MIEFAGLRFEHYEDRLILTNVFGREHIRDSIRYCHFVEVQLAGANHDVHGGAKQFLSSEWDSLKYVSHQLEDYRLEITQRNAFIEVVTTFYSYHDCNTLRFFNTVKNISGKEICIENISTFRYSGLAHQNDTKDFYLYRFTNSWHCECQPRALSFFDLGLFNNNNNRSMKRISGCNTGSWSTKEELPQAIIEDRKNGSFLMFQIENNGSWYWEIGENVGSLYLHLSGPNQAYNQWSKCLKPEESFTAVTAAMCSGGTLNEVVGEMTKYRRHILSYTKDEELPSIFNEYMHLSWDNPYEEQTFKIAPFVAATGIEYYVIDCGWHDEEDKVYPYVGRWRQSNKRFPSGIKHTIDYLHSLGMKAGLWLEMEAVGYLCEEMRDYYNADGFFARNGSPIINMGRLQLDFRNSVVTDFMYALFERLVCDYGVDYIKIDYNQCSGPGTEIDSDSLGDGLLEHNRAYINFIENITKKYPKLVLEACASGGQRMDYKTLSVHSLQSTSDQTDYRRYPYIAANILSAVLPEQAAVWSYPVSDVYAAPDYEEIAKNTSIETVVFNMINAMLGRLHLASHVELLSKEKRDFIREGVEYYKYLTPYKKSGLPYFPFGFTDFSADFASAGFISEGTLFLAVWNMKFKKNIKVPLKGLNVSNVKVSYPKGIKTNFTFDTGELSIDFSEQYQARFFEISLLD